MATKLSEFHRYVHSFYGPQGVYPIGATMPQIKRATAVMLEQTREEQPAFDSVDRERVRDILIERCGLVWK